MKVFSELVEKKYKSNPVKYLREQIFGGISQVELSRFVGVSHGAIAKAERGGRTGAVVWIALGNACPQLTETTRALAWAFWEKAGLKKPVIYEVREQDNMIPHDGS